MSILNNLDRSIAAQLALTASASLRHLKQPVAQFFDIVRVFDQHAIDRLHKRADHPARKEQLHQSHNHVSGASARSKRYCEQWLPPNALAINKGPRSWPLKDVGNRPQYRSLGTKVAQRRNASYSITRAEAFSLAPDYHQSINSDAWGYELGDFDSAVTNTASSRATLTKEPFDPLSPYVREEARARVTQHTPVAPNSGSERAQRSASEQDVIDRLKHLLESFEPCHDELFRVYNSLPEPKASHLSAYTTNRLLHILSVVERKTPRSARRYLTVLDDVKRTGRPISQSQWNSAMSFVSRSSGDATADDVAATLEIWREMELAAQSNANSLPQQSKPMDAHIRNTATFTILLDVCIRAGNFVLAEMIHKEVLHRGIHLNRYYRTTNIYYHGLRRDGEAVRNAYNELVEAGEVVDSVVITCLIAAFLAAGEPASADQVFERAKRIHALKTGQVNAGSIPLYATATWHQRRELSAVLNKAAQRGRKGLLSDPERQAHHDRTPLAPTLRTYMTLVRYHAVVAGDMERVTSLLDEMQVVGLDIPGATFIYLFKAFAMHGGILYTSWTRQRLESLFSAFLTAFLHSRQSGITSTSNPNASSRLPERSHPLETPSTKTPTESITTPSHQESYPDADLLEAELSETSSTSDDRHHHRQAKSHYTLHKIYFSPNMIRLCLGAFIKCADVQRAREVHNILQEHWARFIEEEGGVEILPFDEAVPLKVRQGAGGV